ncbi:hypothetical protein BDF14DRAFT_1862233 [Spinellus fusiger]|nr:hypothetical protein BDF14DRAFT_1862233 [Spinellus fusiger]
MPLPILLSLFFSFFFVYCIATKSKVRPLAHSHDIYHHITSNVTLFLCPVYSIPYDGSKSTNRNRNRDRNRNEGEEEEREERGRRGKKDFYFSSFLFHFDVSYRWRWDISLRILIYLCISIDYQQTRRNEVESKVT